MTWRREDIDIGDRLATEDGSGIWEVIGIADRPTVFLRPASMSTGSVMGGGAELHYVIDSLEFAKWKKVRLEGPR